MKIFEEIFDIELIFPMETLGIPKEDALFFDIETTGLSAYKSNLYLIGIVQYENAHWKLTQYFAESVLDEVTILNAFFSLLGQKKYLISFNGDGFDIPFIKAMAAQYGITHPFDRVESYDIFKYLRPGKKFLNLKSYKLKSCEVFLGIHREDLYSGGELIQVYWEFLKDQDPDKMKLLLLHNAEDLKNLPLVLSMVSYSYLPSAPIKLLKEELLSLPTGDGKVLDLVYESDLQVPKSIDLEENPYFFNVENNRINLSIRLTEEELKYFYSNYRDYYYLPSEDMAIHKSVAEFVSRKHRKKATAQTAYQRKRSIFVPEYSPIFTPVFKQSYKDKMLYAEYQEDMFKDDEKAVSYLREFFKKL